MSILTLKNPFPQVSVIQVATGEAEKKKGIDKLVASKIIFQISLCLPKNEIFKTLPKLDIIYVSTNQYLMK